MASNSNRKSASSASNNRSRRSSASASGRPASSSRQVRMPQANPRSRNGSVQSARKGAMPVGQVNTSPTPHVSSVRIGDIPQRRSASTGKKPRRMSRVLIIIIVIAVLMLAAVIAFAVAVQTDAFDIEEVKVTGVNHLTADETSQLAAVPQGSTLVSVDTAGITDRLSKNPWVQSVTVNRLFPHTLELVVTEHTIKAVVTITSTDDQQNEDWAIADDGVWLMEIPQAGSQESTKVSTQVYEDAQKALHISDVPYGIHPEVGTTCTDSNVNNALNIISGMTTSLADRVTAVSATGTETTTLTLDNGVQIAFGDANNIRDKERVCLQLMEQYPDEIAYINVRVVDRPTWRALS